MNRKPSVNHFRIFGSIAYSYIPNIKRNKLQNKADIGILVGYAEKTKGYRVWLPKKRTVIETIHVKIDESKNGVLTLFGEKASTYVRIFNEDEILGDEQKTKPDTEFKDIDISKWNRVEKPRTKSPRIDVYYYPPPGKDRLRSLNDVKKYCETQHLNFNPKLFNFRPVNTKSDENCSEASINSEEELSENEDSNFTYFPEEIYNIEVPKNYKESQNCPEKDKWRQAMEDELRIIGERKVWKLVDPAPNSKILGCRWVYTIKTDTEDNIKRFKARLVAQGYKQRLGLDYTNIFSPVVNFSIVKLLFICLVCWMDWVHAHLDVKSAYLYGNLKESILMSQPPGYVKKGQESKVCLLQKSLYGLKQSGRIWNKELDSILKSLDFICLKHCNCVYKYKNVAVLLVYVDDFVLFGKNHDCIEYVIAMLKSKLDIVDLGKIRYLLGVNFDIDNNEFYLHQKTYINKLKSKFKDLPKSYVNLPFKVGNLPQKVQESEIKENEIMLKYPYRSLIGCLSFLADRSRPDITFSVNTMAQFCNGYTYEHWLIVADIMNYVFNTSEYKLNFLSEGKLELIAYSDANWGSKLSFRHSTSGYLICIGEIPFCWKSSKQKCIALSSMESEFVALTECVKELLWFSRVINELNLFSISKPTLCCDNKSAIYFCENNIENSKTKHIDIRLHFIRKLLNDDKFNLRYIASKANLADLLTKPQSKDRLKHFMEKLCLLPRGAECWTSGKQKVNTSCNRSVPKEEPIRNEPDANLEKNVRLTFWPNK